MLFIVDGRFSQMLSYRFIANYFEWYTFVGARCGLGVWFTVLLMNHWLLAFVCSWV